MTTQNGDIRIANVNGNNLEMSNAFRLMNGTDPNGTNNSYIIGIRGTNSSRSGMRLYSTFDGANQLSMEIPPDGSGIPDFPNGATGANGGQLVEEQKGNWTPTVVTSGVSFSSIIEATYVKIGALVHCEFSAVVAANSVQYFF